MISRERVMRAINHKEPDKIPVDCGAMRSTGLTGKVYNDLKAYLCRSDGETKVYDMIQQLIIPEDWYLEQFQIDIVDLSRAFANDPKDWIDWKLADGSAVKIPTWLKIEKRGTSWFCIDGDGDALAEMPEGSYFFDQKVWPLLGIHKDKFDVLPNYLKKVMWVHMTDPMWKNSTRPDFYSMIREKAKQLYEQTDYAIMVGFGGQLFELGQYLYRNDEFMINLMCNRKEIEKMLDKLTEIHMTGLEKLLEAVSPYVQVIVMGDDLGTQNGPMISPKLYKEVFFPRHKKMYQYIKKKVI